MAARVLVIDDSPMTVDLLKGALANAGIEADAASDLAALDAKLNAQSYELVLVDVNMPEMYGDDVIEFLRATRQIKSTLLLYSDLPENELEQKAIASGADGYITKSSGLEAAVERVAQALQTSHRPRKVLVVDDSEATAKLLEAELSARGFEVQTADSADKATKIILKKKTRPDLVLLDVKMPNVNGEQFCRFIKSNALFAGIKVLLCSGENESELQRICREAGADGYVQKDALIAKVILDELT
ncbi:MAG: response regulator [Myxococcaceae bacterium]|nr:response regulator [Myxococcaceae bacterium]